MNYYIIDRFEGSAAVCETPGGSMEKLPRDALPPDAAEGDLLFWQGRWSVDRQATENRRAALRAKRAGLRKKEK